MYITYMFYMFTCYSYLTLFMSYMLSYIGDTRFYIHTYQVMLVLYVIHNIYTHIYTHICTQIMNLMTQHVHFLHSLIKSSDLWWYVLRYSCSWEGLLHSSPFICSSLILGPLWLLGLCPCVYFTLCGFYDPSYHRLERYHPKDLWSLQSSQSKT